MNWASLDWSLVANYGGLVVGIVGVLVGSYQYIRSKEVKDPRCFYASFRDVEKLENANSRVKVLYDAIEVNRIYTTYIWFWNAGRKPIRDADLPEQSKLKLTIREQSQRATILGWQIIKTSRSVISLAVEIREDALAVRFDFLDYHDGFVIELQHTGNLSAKVEIEGVILGATQGVKIKPHSRLKQGEEPSNRRFVRPGLREKALGAFIGIVGLFGAYQMIHQLISAPTPTGDSISAYSIAAFLVIGGLSFALLPWTSPYN